MEACSRERKGIKVSRNKTEYMYVNVCERETEITVKLQGVEVVRVDELKYLGSSIKSNRQCKSEVQKRVQAGWNG